MGKDATSKDEDEDSFLSLSTYLSLSFSLSLSFKTWLLKEVLIMGKQKIMTVMLSS